MLLYHRTHLVMYLTSAFLSTSKNNYNHADLNDDDDIPDSDDDNEDDDEDDDSNESNETIEKHKRKFSVAPLSASTTVVSATTFDIRTTSPNSISTAIQLLPIERSTMHQQQFKEAFLGGNENSQKAKKQYVLLATTPLTPIIPTTQTVVHRSNQHPTKSLTSTIRDEHHHQNPTQSFFEHYLRKLQASYIVQTTQVPPTTPQVTISRTSIERGPLIGTRATHSAAYSNGLSKNLENLQKVLLKSMTSSNYTNQINYNNNHNNNNNNSNSNNSSKILANVNKLKRSNNNNQQQQRVNNNNNNNNDSYNNLSAMSMNMGLNLNKSNQDNGSNATPRSNTRQYLSNVARTGSDVANESAVKYRSDSNLAPAATVAPTLLGRVTNFIGDQSNRLTYIIRQQLQQREHDKSTANNVGREERRTVISNTLNNRAATTASTLSTENNDTLKKYSLITSSTSSTTPKFAKSGSPVSLQTTTSTSTSTSSTVTTETPARKPKIKKTQKLIRRLRTQIQ